MARSSFRMNTKMQFLRQLRRSSKPRRPFAEPVPRGAALGMRGRSSATTNSRPTVPTMIEDRTRAEVQRTLYLVFSNWRAGKEPEFHEWYAEHVSQILAVEGFES